LKEIKSLFSAFTSERKKILIQSVNESHKL